MNEAHYEIAGGDDDESDISMMDSDSDEDMGDSKIHVDAAKTNPQAKEIGSSISEAPYSMDESTNKPHHTGHTKEQDVMDTTGVEISKRLGLDDAHQIFREDDGRLLSDRSLLPVEIWHHIFTFTPPRTLGRLLQVNKIFNAYLDSPSLVYPHRTTYLSISVAKVLEPKTIWQASRKLYRPSMPAPLTGLSDLDMWRLGCSNSCQFCGKVSPSGTLGSDVWRSGPGEQGVHPIWAFSIHTCGNCLREKTIKEIDLLLSSSIPSPLMAALPFVFLTNELHVVPPVALEGGVHPPSTHITKFFLKSHVDEIKREFFGVKSLGNGTAEEWLKGLEERGRKRRNDAARWERWQSSGGIARMRTTEPSERPSIRRFSMNTHRPEKPIVPPQPIQQQASMHSNPSHYMPATNMNIHGYPQSYVQPVQNAYAPPRFDSPSQGGFGHPPPGAPQFRQPRTKEEVAELKAARKAEIERRCMLLNPPIPSNVLAHIPSFQAALQIIKPVDDNTWELLVPRLLAQRAEAESRESDRVAQTRAVQEQFDDRRYQDTQAKDVKDAVEKEWEYVQTPIRNRLGEFADEIIREGWASGHRVTDDTSPKFAAEVLIYVRRRFYAEVEKQDEDDRATGKEPRVDPFDGPFTKKLTLENMKWVFDTKIRPLTEQYRKEIFLCNGCESSKFYGFEGVIQHYAAKHTSDLSLGSIVVHWRSEWPDHPPFQADPGSVISEYQYDQSVSATYAHSGHGGYSVASAPHMVQLHVSQPYHHSPGVHYANPSNGDPYECQYPQQYPPHSYAGQGTGYQQTYVDPHAGSYQQYPGGQHHGVPPHNLSHLPQNFELNQTAPYPSSVSPAQGQPQGNFDSQGASYPDGYGNQVSATYPSAGPPPPPPPQPQPQSQPQPQPQLQGEAYQTQLEDVARSAKEAWSATSGIKDLPGSVRVATLLHNIVKQSRAKYPMDPPLSMLIDGLSNHKEMRQVRNINNLSCKTCSNLLANGQPLPINPNKTSGLDKRTFSFPQLLGHFQSLHITIYQGDGPADWTRDMVELPELDRVGRLLHVNGMDDYKLQFIADAVPAAFPWPLPPVTQAKAHNATQINKRGGDGGQSWKFHKNQNKFLDRDSIQYGYERQDNDIVPETSGYHTRGASNQTYDDRRRSPESQEVDEYGREIIRAPAHSYRGSYDNGPSLYGEKEELSLARQLELLEQKSRASNAQVSSQTIPIGKGRPDICQPSIPSRFDPPDGGSEDGEVNLSESISKPTNGRAPIRQLSEVDRFRNDYVSGQSAEEVAKKAEEEERKQEEALRASWAAERVQTAKQMYQPEADQKTTREETPSAPSPIYRQRHIPQQQSPVALPQSRPIRIDPPVSRQPRISAIDYAERYGPPAATVAPVRERSPELVDHRYKLNNSVYRHERQTSRGAQRTPSRYARYESVRLETERARSERARSRSPVYVKVGDAPGQYRERSPVPRTQQPETIYHHRTPSSATQPLPSYERLPSRQEYYTMYDEEPQPRVRQPQIIEQPLYEYIQIADPNGDYIVRRAIRREAEPVYVQYPEDAYAHPIYEDRRPVYEERVSMYDERHPAYEGRQPIYADEGRQSFYAERQPIYERAPPQPQVAISRDDPAYFEEYDPSQPALPPSAGGRMPRY